MKNLIYLLLALPLFMASCTNDDMAASEETVQVCFSATLPEQICTRAEYALTVNKVVCAVFEKNKEVVALRRVISITDPAKIEYAPRLIKGRTYDVVFWAMKEGCYNVDDLTKIRRNNTEGLAETDYDAFTATNTFTVQNVVSEDVKLTRPLAQLNIGVTEEDWSTVTTTFGQTPATTTISYSGKDVFNALTGETEGTDTPISRTSCTSGSALTVNDKIYWQLGTFYVLMDETEKSTTLDIKYTVMDAEEKPIRSDVEIPFVPIQRNYKTNIVGGLLTGTVTYKISINGAFSESGHTKDTDSSN